MQGRNRDAYVEDGYVDTVGQGVGGMNGGRTGKQMPDHVYTESQREFAG